MENIPILIQLHKQISRNDYISMQDDFIKIDKSNKISTPKKTQKED